MTALAPKRKIAEVLTLWRRLQAVSQEDLAAEMGTTPYQVGKLERGGCVDADVAARVIAWLFLPAAGEPSTAPHAQGGAPTNGTAKRRPGSAGNPAGDSGFLPPDDQDAVPEGIEATGGGCAAPHDPGAPDPRGADGDQP